MAHRPPCPRDASRRAIAVRHGFGLADGGRHLRAAQVMRVTTASEGSSRARARRAEDQRTAQLYNVCARVHPCNCVCAPACGPAASLRLRLRSLHASSAARIVALGLVMTTPGSRKLPMAGNAMHHAGLARLPTPLKSVKGTVVLCRTTHPCTAQRLCQRGRGHGRSLRCACGRAG